VTSYKIRGVLILWHFISLLLISYKNRHCKHLIRFPVFLLSMLKTNSMMKLRHSGSYIKQCWWCSHLVCRPAMIQILKTGHKIFLLNFYLQVLHPVAYLSNWFFMTPSIETKFQYINSLQFPFLLMFRSLRAILRWDIQLVIISVFWRTILIQQICGAIPHNLGSIVKTSINGPFQGVWLTISNSADRAGHPTQNFKLGDRDL
jgi:hypothetical protein